MEVFYHHVYEYQKGLRNLILHTTNKNNQIKIEKKLNKYKISYLIKKVSEDKINVFFGNEKSITVLKLINKDSLIDFTDEEDFILGVMLGYDRVQQCQRYIKRKNEKGILETLVG